MQVVYSGGTNANFNPSPSPSRRGIPHQIPPSPKAYRDGWHKTGGHKGHGVASYSRPVMPGYLPGSQQPSVVIHRTVEVQHNVHSHTDSNLKDSIPAMSKPLAIVCLICNILSPGLGTFLSGVSVFCCSEPRPRGTEKLQVVWLNTWVALLQFFTAFLFLLGWIWSIMWGVAFITIANENSKKKKYSEDSSPKDTKHENENVDNNQTANATPRNGNASLRPPSGLGSSRTTTRSITTVSMATEQNEYETMTNNSNMTRSQTHPIIVLQEPPVIVQPNANGNNQQGPKLNPRNPRHQRIMRRQNTAEEISNMFVSPERLEEIVIGNTAAAELPRTSETTRTDAKPEL